MIKKLLKRKDKAELPSRITNGTVAEHREKILAAGRKHKYPLQYTKHRLVWVTAIASVAVLLIFAALVYLQLYIRKDTGDLMYRVTRILPLPIASTDGVTASYSDYLMYHRSNLAVLKSRGQEKQQDKVDFYQKQAIDKALEIAYVKKLAKDNNITVDNNRVVSLIKQQRQSSKLSEQDYEVVVKDNLHWTTGELSLAMGYTLLKQEVSFKIDQDAANLANKIQQRIDAGKNLDEISKEFNKNIQLASNITVSKDNSDGGLTKAAIKVEKGKISAATKTLAGDGYYFTLLHSIDKDKVTYSYFKVPLTEFDRRFNALKNDNKVRYYIPIDN